MPEGLAFANLEPSPETDSGEELQLLETALPKATPEQRQALLDAIKACVRKETEGGY